MRGLSSSSANRLTSKPASAVGVFPFGHGITLAGFATARVAFGRGRINLSDGTVVTTRGWACSAAGEDEEKRRSEITKKTKSTKIGWEFFMIFLWDPCTTIRESF